MPTELTLTRILVIAYRRVPYAAAAASCIAVTAAAAKPVPQAYRGRTAQGIRVKLGPPRRGVRLFRYRARMRCSDGAVFLDRYFTDAVTLRRGAFASSSVSHHRAVKTSVRGRVRARKAGGTIRIVERYSELPDRRGDTPLDANGAIRCDSGKVHWHAAVSAP